MVSPLTNVHKDDEHHEEKDGMDAMVIKALRHRREVHFANEIKGSVIHGKISTWLRHSYAMPSMSTVPLIALITVWVVQFYESLGADLVGNSNNAHRSADPPACHPTRLPANPPAVSTLTCACSLARV